MDMYSAEAARTDVLGNIFQKLRNTSSEARKEAAEELGRYVSANVADMSPDASARLWDDSINRRLFDLMHSSSNAERWGGLVALDQLLDTVEDSLEKHNLYRLYNYVKLLLPNSDASLMLAASRTLGRIVEIGSTAAVLGEGFMNYEIPAAIEAMRADSQEGGRHGGVLVLKELAKNSPSYFYAHIDLVFDNIPVAFKDKRSAVRQAGAELLASCLFIVASRDRQRPYYLKMLQEAQVGLRHTQAEAIHGSLLIYRELFLHGGMFMDEHFVDVSEQILRFKMHPDPLVHKSVIGFIPILAAYDTQTFSDQFLHKAMSHLLAQLDKLAERSNAFIAIGQTAAAVGSSIKPFLDPILAHIKQALKARGKKNAPPDDPIFECLGMLATAVGPNLTKALPDLLDLMFACGLSQPLCRALTIITHSIASFSRTIQNRLLEVISLTLSGKPYRPLGAPVPWTRPVLPSTNKESHGSLSEGPGTKKSPELVKLALETLGTFDFSGHKLSGVVQTCAVPYLDDDNVEVRTAAAITCCHLFVKDPICYQSSNHSLDIVSDVLSKLLAMAIADPDSSIRYTVLSSLHDRFDKHLAQAENVRSLFTALNDEVFENREVAVRLIGRLGRHNPAFVVPSLRKALVQLLTELEYSTVVRQREDCTRLLTLLVNSTHRLLKPYALPMFRALLAKADDHNSTVAANVLMCLGELVAVAGEDAMPHVPELMQVIMTRLSDPANIKRDAALHTLGQICSNTGYVITPLIDYPQLMPALGKILRTEISQPVRREVVKVLGLLGAVDPFRKQTKPEEAMESTAPKANAPLVDPSSTQSGSDEYYQAVVINALLVIMRDSSLGTHHHTVVEAIMSIFKTQGLKCVPFLPEIIPAFIDVTKVSSNRVLFHLQQLAILVGIIKQHIRNYIPPIMALLTELWDNQPLQLAIVSVFEAVSNAMGAEFRAFLSPTIPLLLRVFDGAIDERKMATQVKILDTFLTFGSSIEEYLHLVIPVIVQSYERPECSTQLRKKAAQIVDGLSRRVNLSDHASRIIHPLVRTLESANNEVRMAVLDTLCSLVVQLGSDFAVFIPTVHKTLVRNNISHAKYENLVDKLLNGEPLPHESGSFDQLVNGSQMVADYSAPAEAAKMTVNQQHLRDVWDISQVTTREEWVEWMHRLGIQFMKESPSHALRACTRLVGDHQPLAKELFNAAFLSCWGELFDQNQEGLVHSIETAIISPTSPAEIVHRLLNLAEFMEREERPLPIGHHILGEYAKKFHAYAKALHYKELEYFAGSTRDVIESLISLNTRLQQHDAAWGTLVIAKEKYDVTKHEEWYERLGHWQEALDAYDVKARMDPNSQEIQMGRMKCLHALGEWDQLSAIIGEQWNSASPETRREIAPMGAAAAWAQDHWVMMDEYIATMTNDSADKPFYRAILSVHQNQFQKAIQHIAKARDNLDPELTSFVGDGYGRSYNIMVRAQMLAELEEIIIYKQHADQPEKQEAMRRTWMKRLQGCQPDVEVWQRILQVRSLVLDPESDPIMWIKFSNLCRKSERMMLAEKTINSLLASPDERRNHREPTQKAPPNVIYTQLKYMWANGVKAESIIYLRQFTESLVNDIRETQEGAHGTVSDHKLDEIYRLVARCFFKQGQWEAELMEDWSASNYQDILSPYYFATHYDPSWYKAWHTWALSNFEVVAQLESQQAPDQERSEERDELLVAHVVQAMQGFFQSISLRNEEPLQDTLRLSTLLFKYGIHDNVYQAMNSGLSSVNVETWLEVIPQLIARIQTPSSKIRKVIRRILIEVGRHHPQALVFPLTVASQSPSGARKAAALSIMNAMQDHSPSIVAQARVVSKELNRIVVVWHELWFEALEEASRLYFTEKNAEGMIASLEQLHEHLETGANTAHEVSFAKVFGEQLRQARQACKRYLQSLDTAEMDKAWEIYYSVFRSIERQLKSTQTLDLQYVSPTLLKARDLELAVPGTYQSGKPLIKITGFVAKVDVFDSKQRPRRVTLTADNGRDYTFLLKGHEDLRQDERVMQLFNLVDTLLSTNSDSFKRRLHITIYPVIPLAPRAGLIGWVNDTETLHTLISDYRKSHKILPNLEYRLMLQMAPDYETLTFLQRLEVFEYALQNTSGQDLYRVFWLKSVSSEHWLERRTAFTRSLAVNSMVGHILGLGDRHPSNILLERKSGQVVHIDFGDCFEIAMLRERYPEKVPFRLTRMIVQAMEVSGIEGSFRKTSEITMTVLRSSRESLLAVLEAFVYDPLISWRLMQIDSVDVRRPDTAANQAAGRWKTVPDEEDIFNEEELAIQEYRNESALKVYSRVQHKLSGRDFDPNEVLTVQDQVTKLILQATSLENICQHFVGWCAFW